MVLTALGGGAARPAPRRGERGSQTLEMALATPLLVVLLVLLLHAAVLGADVVAAQAAAQQAARAAAVGGDAAAHEAVAEAAGHRPVRLLLEPPPAARTVGDRVTARVELSSAAFAPFGATVWVPGQATFAVER